MLLNVIASSRRRAKSYRDEVLADNPVAYWRLGETSGTTAADEVGSYNGTYQGTYTLGEDGPITGGKAVGFSGASGEMSASPQSAIGDISTATLECWMYRAASGRIVAAGFGDGNGSRFSILWFSDNNIYFSAEKNSTAFGSVFANLTEWHHLAMVFDGSLSGNARIAFYLDGELKARTGGSGTHPATLAASSSLGNISAGRENLNNRSSNGRIAEMAIYPTALSAARIAAHYDARNNA
jgi:hypothetical protein